MTNIAVLGVQWGDEGKGKIVDWLSERADVIVRFQGGHNAGHTLVIDGVTHKLNLLPSGVVREGKLCVIGNGVVLSPEALLAEIERLRQAGISVGPDRLKISDRTALLLPLHAEADKLKESLLGDKKIGTTGRGIGPAYEDKAGRRALRLCDLASPKAMRERAEALVAHHNALRRGYGKPELNLQDVISDLERSAEALVPFAAPVWKLLDDATRQGKRLLFEGAQGFLLDVDHGTYPFVTSSVTHPAQAAAGAGVGARSVHYVLGVCKAYTTRVGGGPFPTEETGPDGERMGTRGAEFGTVTGRKRRCGWFDAALVSQSCKTAGVDGIALTKLDVLDGAESLKVGVGYTIEGAFYDYLPACSEAQAAAVPVYETLPGWNVSTAMVRSREALPVEAKRYISFIEERIGVEAVMISVGAERSAVIGGEGLYAPVLKCA